MGGVIQSFVFFPPNSLRQENTCVKAWLGGCQANIGRLGTEAQEGTHEQPLKAFLRLNVTRFRLCSNSLPNLTLTRQAFDNLGPPPKKTFRHM